jgi:hypothetical protein
MKDLAIRLEHRPGALAEMGDALGKAGVSISILAFIRQILRTRIASADGQ